MVRPLEQVRGFVPANPEPAAEPGGSPSSEELGLRGSLDAPAFPDVVEGQKNHERQEAAGFQREVNPSEPLQYQDGGLKPVVQEPTAWEFPSFDSLLSMWSEDSEPDITIEENAVAPEPMANGYESVLARMSDESGQRIDFTNIPEEKDEEGNVKPSEPFELARAFIGHHQATETKVLGEFFKKYAGQSINPAVTPWCAAFANAVLGQAGQEGTGKLNARSFLQWGEPTTKPKVGDIVVFSRGDPNGWQGHVGFYAGEGPNGTIKVLGGNQSKQVKISTYKKDRLLGYRRAPSTTSPTNNEQTLISLTLANQ